MSSIFMTPYDISLRIASNSKAKRLVLNLSQKTLAERAGVSLSVIKKFERTGKISLESLLKLALVLGCLGDFTDLFSKIGSEKLMTLDEVLKDQTRKRGRK